MASVIETVGTIVSDPISVLLILVGAALVVLPSAVMGVLTLGGLADLLTRDGSREPPQ